MSLKPLQLFIFFFAFFIFSGAVFAQNATSGKVFYKKEIVFDENNTDPMYKSMNSSIKRSLEEMQYVLEFNTILSKFYLNPVMNSDINKLNRIALNSGNSNGTYYTNLSTRENIREADEFGELLLIINSDHNFRLTKETKEVNGYTCHKAVAEQVVKFSRISEALEDRTNTITAWYTLDIPVQFGPTDVFGLPGLVLELQINNTYYIATDIKLENKHTVIKFPKKGRRVTTEEYNQIAIDLFNSLSKE